MYSIGDWKIGTRLGLGFGLMVLLLVGIAFVGISRLSALNDKMQLITEDRYPKVELSNTIMDNVDNTVIEMSSFLLFSDQAATKEQLKPIDKGRAEIKAAFEKLEKMLNTDAEREMFKAVVAARDKYLVHENEFLRLASEGKLGDAKGVLAQVRKAHAFYADRVEELTKLQTDSMAKASAAGLEQYYSARYMMFGFAGLVILFACGISFWLTRSITLPLKQAVGVAQQVAAGDLGSAVEATSTDEAGQLLQALHDMSQSLAKIVGEVRAGSEAIASGSKQIASGNADLSQRTEEQASSLEETASSMEELTSTVKQNAENSKQANQLALSASEVAVRGGQVVSEVVGTMSSINEASKKIVDIIGVIDGIAFQTNILALNAAVEAARAGEQGRGFAVVASEVRNLAQRSAAAAKEIKALIGDSVEKVDTGTRLVDEAGQTMQEIVTSVKRVTDIMSEITAASQEQGAGIEQVNQAITQMDEVTQQNAALVEEAAAAAESLQEQAQNLEAAVAVFNVANAGSAAERSAQAAHERPARPQAERRGPNRASNVARLPQRTTQPVAPMIKVAAGGGDQQWEEF